MKRFFTITILITATLGTLNMTTAEAHNHRIRDHTRVWRCSRSHDWHRVQARPGLIRCLSWRFKAPGSPDYAVQIGYCESGSDLQDTYGGDGHIGTFQHITSSFYSRWQHWGQRLAVPSNGANVLSNALVSLRMAKSIGTWQGQWSCA